MGNILGSIAQYTIIMIILAALAVAGIFVGKALRQKKDLKNSKTEE